MNASPSEYSDYSPQPGPVSARALFERLAGGATLVTANRRQAQHWKARFDAAQAAAGLRKWATADVLPWSAFLTRSFERISLALPAVPVLLTPEQETVLWESIIERSVAERGLMSAAQTATQCRSAWHTAQAWRLWPRVQQGALSEDVRAFVSWAEDWEAATRKREVLDEARLPDWLAQSIAHMARTVWESPTEILLLGFDLRSPAQSAVLQALQTAGVPVSEVRFDLAASAPYAAAESNTESNTESTTASTTDAPTSATACRVECTTPDEELRAAAAWARQRLSTNPQARIGVVVPDLQLRRDAVVRRFAAALAPGDALAHPVDISIGLRLTDWPLVHDALALLDLARGHALPLAQWSALLASPFVGGGVREYSQRARLDALLRDDGLLEASLAAFVRRITAKQDFCATPILCERLQSLTEALKGAGSLRLSAAEWGRQFTEWLKLVGFPGDRVLDSPEHQTLGKLRSLLESLATLDRVLPRMTLPEALARLRRQCNELTFQPEIDTLQVEVLGILESAGLAFDHLWVSGMTADAWPLAMHAHPFLPLALQRAAGVPEATPAVTLAVDRRITEGWLRAAGEVVFSHALRNDDRDVLPSPLTRNVAGAACVPLAQVVTAPAPDWAAACFASRALESLQDTQAPALDVTAPLSAGTAALRDQSACPFRAIARHRLRAEALGQPQPGLDPAARGTLLHAVLQAVWERLKDHAGLAASSEAALTACVEESVTQVFQRHRILREGDYSRRLIELEAARLKRLVHEWLEVDRARPPFAVEALEEKRAVQAGALQLNVKLDRRDRLLSGPLADRAVVIDYKSGRADPAQWKGERPDEPQLPLYLLTDAQAVAGLAFALVSRDKLTYKGWAAEAGSADGIGEVPPAPGESAAQAWERQVRDWQRVLARLGDDFAAGEATVNPKQATTCQWCDLHALCRVADTAIDPDNADDGTAGDPPGDAPIGDAT